MTDSSDWDIDDTQGEKPQAPKALRSAYDDMKAKNASLERQLEELAGKVRASELKEKFSAKGLPAAAVSLFQGDPTDEAIDEWSKTYGSLFGSQASSAVQQERQEPPKQREENFIMADQFEQMQKASQGASPVGPKDDLQAMLSNPHLQDEVPFADFLAVMRKAGAKV